MFSAEFDYHKASSVAEAIQLLGAHPNAKLMAGGHSLIPLMKLRLARPSAVIDIGGVAARRSETEAPSVETLPMPTRPQIGALF